MAATGTSGSGALLLAGALLSLLGPMPNNANMQAGLTPKFDSVRNMTGICGSIDIRNTLNSFDSLKGCRVVEGFVQILLFDNVDETAFESRNITFPELTEITDFLLLYRVNGLRSVGQLFPNLAVIRGQEKVFGYSFVIYEMSSLQEIGLYSLTDITSGLIRIDKNPSLCFVNSIDWELIAHEQEGHYIKNIKAENECPLCPGDDDSSDKKCPVSTNKDSLGKHLCWNRQHCQKVCPPGCKNNTCDSKMRCCDEKCLGGCKDDNQTHCHVCRKFTGWGDGQCLLNCPIGRYEYLGRRCISKDDCIKTKKPLKLHSKIQHKFPYKIFNNSCLLECPADYMDDYENHTCAPCEGDGRCKKECPGTVIDSIAAAHQLKGCTHINGSLEIQIRGGRNVVNELEENLKMIEEIDGYIKIVRSFPLISLNFLRKLQVIRGNILENQKYVFVVLDNQNLQEIWNWNNRTLRIDHGRLFFHFNPKLCVDKIKTLKERANLSDYTNNEVDFNSNGDKTACNVSVLNVLVDIKKSTTLVLKWNAFELRDQRMLLGYLVYSIKAPYTNISMYDGRDACGGDGWRLDDVQAQENSTPTYILPNLLPYTQYAFYVKTYTIATETTGAQSPIYYVRTMPGKPSMPTEIITSNDKDSMEISWRPPHDPNGNVTYYLVTGTAIPGNREELLKGRNFCNGSITSSHETVRRPEKKPPIETKDTCECKEQPKQKLIKKIKKETEAVNQIDFENSLYNFVYIKRSKDASRRKRSSNEFPARPEPVATVINKNVLNETDDKGRYKKFSFRVNGTTMLKVSKLKHFTYYDLQVQACREEDGEADNICSENALASRRTEKKWDADYVWNVKTNQTSDKVLVSWEEPKEPNGHILAYYIRYKRIGVSEPYSPISRCFSALEYLNNSRTVNFTKPAPGNYSMEITAYSQAGPGPKDYAIYHFYIEEQSSNSAVLFSVLGCCILIVLIGIGYWIFRKQNPTADDMKLIPSVNPTYVSTVYEPDEWEVQRDKIKLIKELGQGSFGMVYEGLAKDIKGKAQTRCAIKTVNEHATNRERIEFLNEASVMKAFDTAHVVRLLGVVSQGQPTLVVMELMANGDLKSYLRSHRNVDSSEKSNTKQPPTLRRIMQMAIEIADGMAYLAAKKFVHRDLAARNCMVAEDLTVKIGDFGMTRDIYETDYYRKGTKGLLPVRWMAPESLRDGVFTSSSDVWSYGVVLWEMATLASQPYQGLSNDQVLRYVIDGGIMNRPENCPDKLYHLMMYCWKHNPSDRPSFLNMCSNILEDASQTFSQISFYHSTAGMEARNSKPTINNSQDDPSTPLRRHQIDCLVSDDEFDQEELEANGYVSNGTIP